MSKKTLIILLAIFLLTFFLRVYRLPQFISYHQDQVRDLIYVSEHFKEKKPILLGPKASVGNFYLPPFWYYLMSISYLFSPSPLAPAFVVVILNSFSVFFLYLFVKEFFNEKFAILSSLIYSFSPLSIEYSRFAWNPNPIPFFTILSLYFLFFYLFKNKKYYIYYSVIFANLTFQLHYQGFLLVFAIFLILLIKKNYRQITISIFLFALLLLPFFIYEIKNNFINIKEIILFFSNSTHSKIFGLNNSLKIFIKDYPEFISRVLFFNNFLLGFLFEIISFFYLIKNLLKIKNLNDLVNKPKNLFILIILILLFTLFIYRQWVIAYYLLVLLIPLIILFVLIFQKYLFLIIFIIILNIINSPSFKSTDSSYLFFINSLKTIKENNVGKNCLYLINKNPDLNFVLNGIDYLLKTRRINFKNKCSSEFIFCENSLCDKIKNKKVLLESKILDIKLIKK